MLLVMRTLRLCLISCSFAVSPAWADDAYDDQDLETDAQVPAGSGDPDATEPATVGAGGLNAPGALNDNEDDRSSIEKELEEADRRDSGRGLEFVWLNAELGFSTLELNGFSNGGGLLDSTSSAGGTGLLYGGAAGVRFLYFTLGGRFRMVSLADMRVWSVAAEAGLKVPFGNLEPHVSLGLGYFAVGEYSAPSAVNVHDIDGFDLRLTGGLDYYLGNYFSIGAAVSADMLFLGRPADAVSGLDGARGIGAKLAVFGVLGFHF